MLAKYMTECKYYVMSSYEVDLSVAGRVISTEAFRGDGSSAVLFLHGYLNSRTGYGDYARTIAEEAEATCLTIDLGGHGESFGDAEELTTPDHLEEAAEAFDFLASRAGVDATRIGVVGESYGGYLAVLLSARRPVKGMVLGAPAIYPDELMDYPRRDYDDELIAGYRRNLRPTQKI